MLPNYSPLLIAEQFGTLEAFYPGRIDLGLGRAAGSDAFTAQRLNRSPNAGEQFPQQLEMLRLLLGPFKVLKLPDASLPVAGPHLFNRQVPQAYG
jgi:alkanesulfonate monooxygenase SsuD/methylene tetrahydromethanopterin reductase-like flavin-dependent oxidoreductase (luciferase family)